MLPVVKAALGAAVGEATAIDVDHNWLFRFTTGRYPNVQSKTVLAEGVGKLEQVRKSGISLGG